MLLASPSASTFRLAIKAAPIVAWLLCGAGLASCASLPNSEDFSRAIFQSGLTIDLEGRRARLNGREVPVEDCSNDEFSCVKIEEIILAVPKECERIHSGSRIPYGTEIFYVLSERNSFEAEYLPDHFDGSKKYIIHATKIPDLYFDYSFNKGIIGAIQPHKGRKIENIISKSNSGRYFKVGPDADYVRIDGQFGICRPRAPEKNG